MPTDAEWYSELSYTSMCLDNSPEKYEENWILSNWHLDNYYNWVFNLEVCDDTVRTCKSDEEI